MPPSYSPDVSLPFHSLIFILAFMLFSILIYYTWLLYLALPSPMQSQPLKSCFRILFVPLSFARILFFSKLSTADGSSQP